MNTQLAKRIYKIVYANYDASSVLIEAAQNETYKGYLKFISVCAQQRIRFGYQLTKALKVLQEEASIDIPYNVSQSNWLETQLSSTSTTNYGEVLKAIVRREQNMLELYTVTITQPGLPSDLHKLLLDQQTCIKMAKSKFEKLANTGGSTDLQSVMRRTS